MDFIKASLPPPNFNTALPLGKGSTGVPGKVSPREASTATHLLVEEVPINVEGRRGATTF